MAPGELFPPFFFDYARPHFCFLRRNKKKELSLGFYRFFSLVSALPLTFH
jgi:hypothetical protein